MKTKRIFLYWFIIFGLLVSPILWSNPASAANQPIRAFNDLNDSSAQDYLITLPVLRPDGWQFKERMDRPAARDLALQMTLQQAAPLQVELERLKEEGSLSGFEIHPELHGIALYGLVDGKIEQLSVLPGIAAILPLGETPPACAVASAQAMIQQFEGVSETTGLRQSAVSLADTGVQTTNPSIEIYYYEDGWGSVSGQTNANIPVSLRILRGGAVLTTQSTSSQNDGYYAFYPDWAGCPSNTYNWSLRPGDIIEVSAAGRTYSSVVANLIAWADPLANQVSGNTDPGRSVVITVSRRVVNSCEWTDFSLTVSPNANGDFSAHFGSLVDFDRSAQVMLYSRDANGNSTTRFTSPYSIGVDHHWGDVSGYLKPFTAYTLTLLRGGNPIDTFNGTTNMNGHFYGWFSDELQPGDVIAASGGGVTVQFTIAPLTGVSINPALNQVSGTTAPNRGVLVSLNKAESYQSLPTSCSYGYACFYQNSDSGGSFSITSTGFDLVRGDRVWITIYDSEGNVQYNSLRVAVISANLSSQRLQGVWQSDPNSGLTITHKNSGNIVRNVYNNVSVYWYDFYFSIPLNETIDPGDRFEVSDGTLTETMIVPASMPTARLNSSSGHLTGNAPAGSNQVLAVLSDYRSDMDVYETYCNEVNPASPGAFDLTFSGAQVNGVDESSIFIRGSDGHYTSLYRRAFYVYHWLGYSYINGYTENPNVNVTVILRRGTTMLDSDNVNSNSHGFWEADFSMGTNPGDRIEVTTGDGSILNLDIPELTANEDVPANRIYGKSPANRPVLVQLRRHIKNGFSSFSRVVIADGAGNYTSTFNNLYWSRDCSTVSLTHRCSASGLRYYTPAGHGIFLWGEYPPPAPADSFEPDNDSASAVPYVVAQTHTFDSESDADWVSFSVPAGDILTYRYQIRTFNTGWGVDTRIYLYHSDGTNIIWDYGWNGIQWMPEEAGVYYVKIIPYNNNSAAFCDAYYDVLIQPVRSEIFLPNITQR